MSARRDRNYTRASTVIDSRHPMLVLSPGERARHRSNCGLTTLNLRRVQSIVGIDETVYEVVGEPSEIDEIVRAVKEASRARATR